MPSVRSFRLFQSFAWMLALLIALPLLSACTSLPSETAPMKVQNYTDGYLLEPGNRIRVNVFNETNLSGDYTLDLSGNVSLPLMGMVQASGLTAKQLTQRVVETLKKGGYLQDPQVAIEVESFRPFYVLGEVRTPGEFPYLSGMTVLSAIAKAGGYDYRAREGEVVIVRIVNGEQTDYLGVERTPILPGDIVRVLQRHF